MLESEKIWAEPVAQVDATLRFLFVDPDTFFRELRPKNMGTYLGEVPDHLLAELGEYYAPRNARLATLVGRDFGW